MNLRRSLNGALAGGAGAAVWAAGQPLDKQVFGCAHDDVELLGKLVTRGPEWPVAGLLIHVAGGAAFGAAYAQLKAFLPGHPLARALTAGMLENFALWPLTRVIDRHHPARGDLTRLWGNNRALLQATWRHAVFSLVMGEVERRLNDDRDVEPPPEVPVSSNGHGAIEVVVAAA